MAQNWLQYKLHSELILKLQDVGYTKPTGVQEQSLFYAHYPVDLIVAAKTGSGKTMTYVLPILSNIFHNIEDLEDRLQGLVLVPTRELALQVFTQFKKML
jgi:ATP-dependent RNA helicase DDX24/MAK5